MIIDCADCTMQGTEACEDCVVTSLLHHIAGPLEIDRDQAEALEVLAEHGLIPRLQMVRRAASG